MLNSRLFSNKRSFSSALRQLPKAYPVPELLVLSSVQPLDAAVPTPWNFQARDQGAEHVGREKTETAKLRRCLCTMACEHRSHSASKKWLTVNRLWPCYLLCSTADLTEIIYPVIYMASITATSEHSQTRWVYPHRAPEKEHMLLALHHTQGAEAPKRQNGFSRETKIWCAKTLYHTRGLLGPRCHAQGQAIGRPVTTLVNRTWTMVSTWCDSCKKEEEEEKRKGKIIIIATSEKCKPAVTEEPVTQFTKRTEAIVFYEESHSPHFSNPENAPAVPSWNILRLWPMYAPLSISFPLLLVFPCGSSHRRGLKMGKFPQLLPGLNPEGGKPTGTPGITSRKDSALITSFLLLFKMTTVEMLFFLVISPVADQSPKYQVVRK